MRTRPTFRPPIESTHLPGLHLIFALLLMVPVGEAWSTSAVASPAALTFSASAPPARVQTAVSRHVDAEALAAWRDTCSRDGPGRAAYPVDSLRFASWKDNLGRDEEDAFDFLFSWLPSSDLAAWRSPQILEDIALAIRTWHEAPWSAQIDEDLFQAYVLPHRVAQEPIQPWRKRLHDLLWDRVKNMTLREAALETNRFCREYATFIPTTARDQGPLTTMERGLGRCEEETIFFTCAARSVGIPARPCYTPIWTATDGNHAWVEVWTGDGWHYLGACEPAADLDQAWFTGPARRAGLVLAVAYGEERWHWDGRHSEDLYSTGDGITLLNTTYPYTNPGRVTVRWADVPLPYLKRMNERLLAGDSLRAVRDSVIVHVNVFNWGSLTELGRFPAGSFPWSRWISLGPGNYVLSCQVDGKSIASMLRIRPGADTTLVLDPTAPDSSRLGWLEHPFWLRVPMPPPPAAGSEPPREVDPLIQRTHELAVTRNDLDRTRRSRLDPELVAEMAARFLREGERPASTSGADQGLKDLLTQLESAGPRAPAWTAFLTHTPGDTFRVARDMALEFDEKDFLEGDTTSARTALREGLRVRAWRERVDSPVPDSLWIPFVLGPRIDLEPTDLDLWSNLPLLEDSSRAGHRPMLAESIHALFARRMLRADPTHLGHIATPSQSWASRYVTPAAAKVALAGLLRRNGIPARLDAERRWVEAWVGGEWIPVDPLDAHSWNRREGAAAGAYAQPARLDVTFLELGAPMTHAEGWLHFRLARLRNGAFEPLRVDYPASEGHLRMEIEPGEWWLFGGERNHLGDARVVARRFQVAAGDSISLSCDLGIPPQERDPEDLAPRQLSADGVQLIRNALIQGSAEAGPSPVLVFLWRRSSEPCRRTADALSAGAAQIHELGIRIVSLEMAEPEEPAVPDLLAAPREQSRIPTDQARAAFGAEALAALPLLAIVDPGDRTRLWLTGMQPAAIDLARQAMAGR